MTALRKVFQIKEIQRQLDLKALRSSLAIVHKLRKAMGEREGRYTLEGMIMAEKP